MSSSHGLNLIYGGLETRPFDSSAIADGREGSTKQAGTCDGERAARLACRLLRFGAMKTPRKSTRDVVKLTDLVPVNTVKGGSGQVVFGADRVGDRQASPSAAKPKDMTPKKNPQGGAHKSNR